MTFPKGQQAMITGASSGIGEETKPAIAGSGIHVALISRWADQRAVVAEKVCQLSVDAQVYPQGLAQVDRVREPIEAIATNFDRTQMLTPEIIAQSILQIVQLPASAPIEELTLISNAGVL
jgi:NADP-dependent 3-hydroxy acid dehydrogenase YdfG